MTKRTFDLIVAVNLGVWAAMVLPRLWATRRCIEGTTGAGGATAHVVKTVTA